MPYLVPIGEAEAKFPNYDFVAALTPSEQKAAFHVRDSEGRDWCLKLISPNFSVDRLNREITALQQINDSHVVRLEEYTFSSKSGELLHYIVEEFVEGQDLSDLLLGTPWEITRVLGFFIELCQGLETLRSSGIVHRDLKPSNIRVRPTGSPVIIDFGLARLLNLPDLTRTADGAAIGTPNYFAPEQFEGTKREIDHRTDLFAVGVLMYEALMGFHPFYAPGTTWADLKDAVCTGEDHLRTPEFQNLPERWQVLLKVLLARSRVGRAASAGLVISLLQNIQGAQ